MTLFGGPASTSFGAQNTAFNTSTSTAQDAQVTSPPSDTVSSLNFTPNPNENFLLATSWSGQVQLWEVGMQGTTVASQPKAEIKHDLPLDSAWTSDGKQILTCGCDRTVKLWDLGSNSQKVVGQHDGPIRHVCMLDPSAIGNMQVVATGGWDNKLKYWDLRTNGSIGEVQLEAKVYAMDTREQLLVVGTAEQPNQQAAPPLGTTAAPGSDRTRKIYVFDLKNPNTPFKVEPSPLSFQTRCVAAFPGNAGYLVGSIEGRVAVQNFEGMHPDKQASYTFKCHRRTLDANANVAQNTKGQYGRKDVYDEVYAVNVIRFHPIGTFMTAGSDGNFTFWDKDEKARLCKSHANPVKPITAASYNSTGTIMAYSCGYDWAQGHAHHDPTNPANQTQISLHRMEEREFQRRKNAKK